MPQRAHQEFVFTAGLDDFIDERQTVKLRALNNCAWTRGRQLRCRPGSTTITIGGTITNAWNVIAGAPPVSPYQELLGLDGSFIYEYSDALVTWKTGDRLTAVSVAKTNTSITTNTTPTNFAGINADVAYCNGYLCYTYTIAGVVHFYVENATTGAIVVPDQVATLADAAAMPKVVATATKFYIFYYRTSDDVLRFLTVDATTFAVSAITTITLFSSALAGSAVFDVAYNSTTNRFALSWMHLAGTYAIETFDTTLAGLFSKTVVVNAGAPSNWVMSLAWAADGQSIYGVLGVTLAGTAYLLAHCSQNIAGLTARYTSMTTAAPVQSAFGYTSGNFEQLGVIETNAGSFEMTVAGTLEDLVSDSSVNQTIASLYSWRLQGSAGAVSVKDGHYSPALTLMTRPWVSNGRTYVHALSLASVTSYVLDVTSSNNAGAPTSPSSGWVRPVAIFNGRTAGRPVAKSWAEPLRSASTVASVVSPAANQFITLSPQIQLQTANLDSILQRVTFDFTWGQAPLARGINSWAAPGGLPSRLSRFKGAELLPLGAPSLYVRDGVAGTGPGAGSIVYQACYAFVTDDGTIVRGPFGPPFQYTAPGGHKANVFIVGPPPTAMLQTAAQSNFQIVLEIYRTQAAGAALFLVYSSATAVGITGLTSAVTTWIVDDAADTVIASNLPAYWNGGGFANVCPNACTFAARIRDRIWMGPGDDGFTLYYSDTIAQTTPATFHDENVLYVDAGGPITAVEGMDAHVVIFKRNRLFYVAGEPGNSAGNGSTLTTPAEIPSGGIGCVSQRSVVLIPDGIMFQSSRGIELLDRSLTLQWIGAPVITTLDSFTVCAAINVPEQHQARFFLTGSTKVLVYDYAVKEWSTYTYPGAAHASATVWQTLPTWASNGGRIDQERAATDLTRFLDNSNFIVMSLTTDWKHMAGIMGFQRLKKLAFLAEWHGAAGLTLTYATDYDETVKNTYAWSAATISALPDVATTPGRVQLLIDPSPAKVESFSLGLTTVAPSGAADGTEGLWLNGFMIEYAITGTGFARFPDTNRK
jgi:hypothetical protein